MTAICLTGLDGGHPLAALAAFGTLRAASELRERLGEPRLAWVRRPTWKPVLTLPVEQGEEALLDALVERQRERAGAPELTWADDIKQPTEDFREFTRAVSSDPDRRASADFAAAYGSDLVEAQNRAEVKPTAFHMTSGQQRFLAMAHELALSLSPESGANGGAGRRGRVAGDPQDSVREAFREALFGPWRYQDRQHSLGWDPDAERLHALRAQSPTSEEPIGVRAAIWLAFEALPFFPSGAVAGRLRTGGFHGKGDLFCWPIWELPLPADAVRSLLLIKELGEDPVPRTLKARGVTSVYRAQRAPLGDKGYAIFRPATLVGFGSPGGE